jgi:hypothetical protein
MKSGFRGVLGSAGVIGLCLVALIAVPASAAPVAFGAKLTVFTQAQSAMSCHGIDPGDIPVGGVCTWVAGEAFENGSHATAPMNGTLHKVKLISCSAGKFTLQMVKKNANGKYALGRTDNQVINYKADPRQIDGNPDTECGGPDGDDYLIQTFTISLAVKKGEYIAVRTGKLGTIRCSGQDLPIYYPALSSTTNFRTKTTGGGCGMLVRVIY